MNVNLPHTATDTDSRDRLLSDLRQAVAAEIAATKSRAAVFRAEVWSGKLHTESERNHIYTFLLDTVVPIADDMPGELHVGGKGVSLPDCCRGGAARLSVAGNRSRPGHRACHAGGAAVGSAYTAP